MSLHSAGMTGVMRLMSGSDYTDMSTYAYEDSTQWNM
jgi:hypothetical protein